VTASVRLVAIAAAAVAGLAVVLVLGLALYQRVAPPPDAPTFNRDVAPIVFENCAGCHRPGESAPFKLLTYRDVKRRASDILEVIGTGFMPPWLPEPGYVEFYGQRGLSGDEIDTIKRWVKGWSPEGDPADLPPLPSWPEGWQLGEPDLVVRMAEPYVLAAEGRDVFRNFVIPIPVEQTRYVRGVELRPGNPKVVHHAIMRIDPTSASQRLAERDPELGFGGMDMGSSEDPDGHFYGWTPGKLPFLSPEDLAWRLEKGTSVVLQVHMKPSGKREQVQPSIGFFFGNRPPARRLYPVLLNAAVIDIPPGVTDYVVRDVFTLPVDVEALSVYPHAHYLGKHMKVFAELPDGSEQWLVRIPDWDFDWQDTATRSRSRCPRERGS
jgi:mono/diheme cytochrome c family protein